MTLLSIETTDSIVESIIPNLKTLSASSVDSFLKKIISDVTDLAISIVIAIVVFYIGKFLIKKAYKITQAILLRRNIDKSLTTFVLSFVNIVLYFVLIIVVIGILGIETSSFLALFASAGVAIGMALSGTLQNFAGGVLILFLKPYKIGDYIVDFYCYKAKLAVELDGSGHYEPEQIQKDQLRTKYINQQGISVLRFTNIDVQHNFYSVCTFF